MRTGFKGQWLSYPPDVARGWPLHQSGSLSDHQGPIVNQLHVQRKQEMNKNVLWQSWSVLNRTDIDTLTWSAA